MKLVEPCQMMGQIGRIRRGMTPKRTKIDPPNDTHLHHQSDDEDHCHAADDVSVILNDEFMAQDRWILLVLLTPKSWLISVHF